MPKPITPLVGCDIFIVNENSQVLLIKRSDSDLWALPGGFIDLGETPEQCVARECFEETGFTVSVECLLGVFSSNKYEYVHYKWKENEIIHLLFTGKIEGGEAKTSSETTDIQWFGRGDLPEIFDGHSKRIEIGFLHLTKKLQKPYFE